MKLASGEERLVNLSGPQVKKLQRSPVLDGLLVIDELSLTLTGRDLPEGVWVGRLSVNSFQ